MPSRKLTLSDLEWFKREAKKLRRLENVTHLDALNSIAKREGFADWWHLQQSASCETDRSPPPALGRRELPRPAAVDMTAVGILSRACSRLLDMVDFWLLSSLGDWSFEEGERNRKFRRYLESWDDPDLPLDANLLAAARKGINGSLHELIGASPGVVGPVLRNVSFGPDLLFSLQDGIQYRVQVKQVFDCTLSKYFAEIAADSTKQCDFQVVFFVSLPEYDYAPGFWYGSDRLDSYRKTNLVGVPAQFTRVCNLLGKMPLIHPDLAYTKPLPAGTALVTGERIERRLSRVFRPTREWRFDTMKHLDGATIAVAIWNWMEGSGES